MVTDRPTHTPTYPPTDRTDYNPLRRSAQCNDGICLRIHLSLRKVGVIQIWIWSALHVNMSKHVRTATLKPAELNSYVYPPKSFDNKSRIAHLSALIVFLESWSINFANDKMVDCLTELQIICYLYLSTLSMHISRVCFVQLL